MQLVVLGLNHKTAPVEVRECFSFSEEQVKKALKCLRRFEEFSECVLLSTCNRTELYAVVEDADTALPVMRRFLQKMAVNQPDAGKYLFFFTGEDCINHLFRVASSLDSLIIGEGQILSQVKRAYSLARDVNTTSTVLNTLFHKAIAVGKKVRTVTHIAYSAVSVSYAAVEMAKNAFGELTESNVLLVGAGQMSELTSRHLVANGVKTVFVSNRNYSRAVELAKKFNGIAVHFEHYIEAAHKADIVITSTGAPHYMIHTMDVARLMQQREGRPLIFIDIAVPRDVEPEVGEIKGVTLYNIDDLEAVVATNIKLRKKEALAAEKIIDAERAELVEKFRYLSYQPVLANLRDKAEQMRLREVKRALAKLPDISPEERKIMENMSKMIVRKLMRDPMIRMNEVTGTNKEHFYVEAICSLFKLNAIEESNNNEKQYCYRYARQ
ncbi:MAG: glutamyl-tRNA reductase [Acidaminococcaceae bacterium]